jgi:hypothetical protein
MAETTGSGRARASSTRPAGTRQKFRESNHSNRRLAKVLLCRTLENTKCSKGGQQRMRKTTFGEHSQIVSEGVAKLIGFTAGGTAGIMGAVTIAALVNTTTQMSKDIAQHKRVDAINAALAAGKEDFSYDDKDWQIQCTGPDANAYRSIVTRGIIELKEPLLPKPGVVGAAMCKGTPAPGD